jgi:peptide-methionine (S)-S-oxide reductase
MSAPKRTPRVLPAHPSQEHLRKQAKRLARDQSLGLAAAQRRLARDYGAASWTDLMHTVDAAQQLSPLAAAAKAGNAAAVRRLLRDGANPDGVPADRGPPLWQASASDAPAAARLAIVDALLEAGANPRRDGAGETALHAAARRGPLALVERLIVGNALEWQSDRKRRIPLAVARRSDAVDKAAIVALLDRDRIDDPSMRAAVKAVQRGDAVRLARLLDAEPRLLHERILGPEAYRKASRSQYFRDPRLFWFIANNPTLVKRMAPNMVAVAETMIARGVEQDDLDYALGLVMTSAMAREQGLQAPLVRRLVEAGAVASPEAIDMTLGHWELEPVRLLLAGGQPMTAPIAAAFGALDRLPGLLASAPPDEVQRALGMAVINRQTGAARLALDAGADPNVFLPVHAHSLPLHQAALDQNLALMELLVARGARTDVPDKLWGGTPLGWAIHENKARARKWLENIVPPHSDREVAR